MSSAASNAQRINCPHCQASIKAPSLPSGASVACPRCGKPFMLGGEAPSVVATPESARPDAARPTPSASKPPDVVVDPMLQPVVRKKPAQPASHNEFAVPCKLCGTRVYARPEQIGQQLKCPDCHSPVEVVAPRTVKTQPANPTLDDVEEVPLDEPAERPRYRPIVRPEGDDAILSLLNDPPFDRAANPTGEPQPPPRSTASSPRRSPAGAGKPTKVEFPPVGGDPETTSSADDAPTLDDDDDDFELRLSEPIERPQMHVELPHHMAADLPDPRDESSYDDALWGGDGSGNKPSWQKSPFLVGVVEFLFYPTTLSNWVTHMIFAALLCVVMQYAAHFSKDEGVLQLAGLGLSISFTALLFIWGSSLLSACLGIVTDTANGHDAVEDWAEWQISEWIGRSMMMGAAIFVSSLPGMFLGSAILAGGGPMIAVPLPILACLVALFPIVLSSMLLENSFLAVYSSTVVRMMRTGAEGWVLFYMISFVIGMFAIGPIALMELNNVFASIAAGVIGVTLAFLYMRLLGRLMWYSQAKLTEEEEREEARRRWAERTTRA